MSASRSDLMPNIVVIPIGSIAATTTQVLPGLKLPRHSKIKSVSVADQAGIASDAANHVQVKLEDMSGNAIASLDSSAVALPVNQPEDLALQAGGSVTVDNSGELDVPAGTSLKLSAQTLGTSVMTLAVLQIEWYPA